MKKLLKIPLLIALFLILAYVRLISQSPTILPFGPITSTAIFKKNVTIEGDLTVEGASLISSFTLPDTDGTNVLTLTYGDNDSSDRELTIKVDGGDRELELKNDLTCVKLQMQF